MRLTIVVPAHNEFERIGRMLDAYLPYFSSRYGAEVEVLVVVNGSTDRTEELVRDYARRFPIVRVVVEPARIGKGGAVILGFQQARGELVGFVDADGSTPPEAFEELVRGLGDAGAIIASRWCRGAQVSPRQPLGRRVASRLFNGLTRLLFGLRLTDTQCGAKLLRRAALEEVLPRLGITRWAFDVDLLFQLRRAGHVIREVPTTWRDVPGSKLEVAPASLEMLVALIRLRLIYSPFRFLVRFYDRYIGPWLQPPGAEQDHLIRHSLLLLTGSQVSNVCNLVFQVIMVRLLNTEQYGVLAAMLGLVAILSMPLGGLGGTVTHYAARLYRAGHGDRVKAMALSLSVDMAVVGLALVAVTVAAGRPLATFFHLPSAGLLVLTAVIMAVMLQAAVSTGVLTGIQAFFWATASGNLMSVVRLGLALVYVAAGLAAAGALTAHLAATLAALAFALYGCQRRLGPALPRPERLPGTYAYLGQTLLALAAFGVLANADVVLVKHYFPAAQAGAFAKAAMVARILVFLPQPVATAMFPKVASGGEMTAASRRTLGKALVLVSMMVGGLALLCTLAPGLVLRVLARDPLPELVPAFRLMVWALGMTSVVFLVLNYELAQRRFAATLPFMLWAAGYVAGVIRWHDSPLQVTTVLTVASAGALVSAVWVVLRHGNRIPERNVGG